MQIGDLDQRALDESVDARMTREVRSHHREVAVHRGLGFLVLAKVAFVARDEEAADGVLLVDHLELEILDEPAERERVVDVALVGARVQLVGNPERGDENRQQQREQSPQGEAELCGDGRAADGGEAAAGRVLKEPKAYVAKIRFTTHTGATWFRRGRFSGRAASRGPRSAS
jgi:hypothetical protein